MKRRPIKLKKRRRKTFYLILTVIVPIAVISTYVGYIYISNYNVDVMKAAVVDFTFVLKNGEVVFVRDSSPKKIVYLVVFPPFSFDGDKLLPLYGDTESIARNAEKMLELQKADGGVYYTSLDEGILKKMAEKFKLGNSKDFVDFVERFSRRGFKFFDLMRIIGISKILKTSGNIGREELLRFLNSVGKHAVLVYEVKPLISKPIVVKTSGKEFKRIYLSPDSLKSVREVIK